MTDISKIGRMSESSKAEGRRLSRHETHDLSMIVKDRTKVLKRHAEEQAAACMADFEKKLSTIYQYDQDEVWKAATEEAMKVVAAAQERIEAQCRKRGIPKDLSPQLQFMLFGLQHTGAKHGGQ